MRVVTPREGSTSTRCLFRRVWVPSASFSEARFLPAAASRFSAALYTVDMALEKAAASPTFFGYGT